MTPLSLFDDTPPVDPSAIPASIPTKIPDAIASRSIELKTQLSLFQSPYAQVTTSASVTPDYTKNPPYLEPQIKIITYGTASGKTYGALNQFILFVSMNYPDRDPSDIYHRNLMGSHFSNAIFATPNKNQIHFDEDLVKKMLKVGITPLSVLALGDTQAHDNKVWNGGLATTEERLKDYVATCELIINTHSKNPKSNLKYWQKGHTSLLLKNAKALRFAVADLKHFYQHPPIDKAEYEKTKVGLTSAHDKAVQVLVLTCLNNIFNHFAANNLNTSALTDDIDDHEHNDLAVAPQDEESLFKNGKPIPEKDLMYPIPEDKVLDAIFMPAKPKPHYDSLLATEIGGYSATLSSEDSFDCMLATLKKDILRVYAPMNYAAYSSSFICLTTAKIRVRPSMYRPSKGAGKFVWLHNSSDYSDFAELIGNKEKHQGALPAIPDLLDDATERQVDMLNNTLMSPRQDLRDMPKGSAKGAGFDNRTPYVQNDISFYIIVDEANEWFTQSFIGDTVTSGVVKPVFDKHSTTDLLSCASRKYSELYNNSSENIDCAEQNKYFFEYMFFYLENFCEIDPYKVFARTSKSKTKSKKGKKDPKPYLLRFDYPPNILYIDNSEAKTITGIIKNAFSVTAKKFIDKDKLESIYVCRRGEQLYLSQIRKKKSDLTLYELYQIIISILFAAMKFEGSDISDNNKSKFNPNERRAFYLDLDSSDGDNDGAARQNAPLAALIMFAKKHAAQYQDWLLSDHLNSHPDATIDDWFAYIQTKLLFTLTHNKTFDASPDKGHQLKTFIDIKMHLITHHPELDALKMVVGTSNHLHLMSATSGKTNAYSDQFNVNFLRRWGDLLGVQVSLPEYDHAHKIDYRETFTEFRDLRSTMRDIEVVTYKDAKDLQKQMLIDPPAQSSRLSINPAKQGKQSIKPAKLKSYLMAIDKADDSSSNWMEAGSFNDRAFDNAVTGLYIAMQKLDTTLLISYRSDLNKLLIKSMLHELSYDSPNDKLLNKAIHTHQTHVVFYHAFFGEFQLPLLNEYLEANHKAIDKAQLKKYLREQFIYLTDFYDLTNAVNAPANKISRIALYDAKIDKFRPDYRDYFTVESVNHNGQTKQLCTTIVSYNKVAALGLNNVINNKILGITEDVNRLVVSSLSFWTNITSKTNDKADSLDGRHKIHNSLIYMRYLADHRDTKPTIIRYFDSNLSSQEAHDLLNAEHNIQLSNNFKQLLGRPERKDTNPNFMSQIILPADGLKQQTKINYIAYGLDESLESRRDKTDFAFLSLNNYHVLKHGMKLLACTTTTPELRSKLEVDTAATKKRIEAFTNSLDGFMGRVLQAARNGDSSEDARELADAAIEFDLLYRLPCILLHPQLWLLGLKESTLLSSPDLVRKIGWSDAGKYLDDMYVDLNDYSDSGEIDVYQHIASGKPQGLTDFFGRHSGSTEPYDPSKYVVSNVAPSLIHKNDINLNRLVAKNNSLTDINSDAYSNDNKKDVLLHPAMMHMALGNLGERVFDSFLDIYEGRFDSFSQKDVIHKFGYRFYELFDFWLYNHSTSRWVCIDVKNYSHKENHYQTEKLLASGDRKTNKVTNAALFDSGSDADLTSHLQGMKGLFDNSNEMHMVFINIRNGEFADNKLKQRKVVIDGRELVINIHHFNIFKPVRFIDPIDRKMVVYGHYNNGQKRQPKQRTELLAINPLLLELLSIDKAVEINNSFHYVKNKDEEDYDIATAAKAISKELLPTATDLTTDNH